MRVAILGCGRVGSTMAAMMSNDGHDVTIMDQNPDSFRRLPKGYKGKTLVGNGIDEEFLRHADMEHADAFVAVTNGDNRNIMSAQIAKVRFKVPRVAARLYDPIRAAAYAEMGLNTICITCVGAGLIRDKLLGREYASVEDYCKLGIEMNTEEDLDE